MSKLVSYYLFLVVLQVSIGLVWSLAYPAYSADVSLPIAGFVAASMFLRPTTIRSGLERVRESAPCERASHLDRCAVGLLTLSVLGVSAAGYSSGPMMPSVMAAFFEEVFLRSVPLLILAAFGSWTRWTVSMAVIASSVIFAAGHDLAIWYLTADRIIFATVAAVTFLESRGVVVFRARGVVTATG